jgi:UDP-glucose 4-epimerase
MNTVVITGANGFLGGAIARRFHDDDWYVAGIDRSVPRADLLPNLGRHYAWSWPDTHFRETLRELKPNVLVHCAGQASVPGSFVDPRLDYESGPPLVFELLDQLRRHSPVTRFIMLSSAAVYGNPVSLPVSEEQPARPLSPYGFHKWQCEQLCTEFARCFSAPTASLRIFSAYGPGLRRQVIWDLCEKLTRQAEPVLQGDGSESRDFIVAADVAQAVYQVAARAACAGEVYNVSNGRATTIAELAERLVRMLGVKRLIRFDGRLPPGTPRHWQADISKICALGFQPAVSLEEGLALFVNWYRAEVLQPCKRDSA